jgi:hypothetical protein
MLLGLYGFPPGRRFSATQIIAASLPRGTRDQPRATRVQSPGGNYLAATAHGTRRRIRRRPRCHTLAGDRSMHLPPLLTPWLLERAGKLATTIRARSLSRNMPLDRSPPRLLPRLHDVVSQLHPQKVVHVRPERLSNAQRHLRRQRHFAVQVESVARPHL